MVWMVITQPPQTYETKEWNPCETPVLKLMVLATGISESGQWFWVFSDLLQAEEGKRYIEKMNHNTTMKLSIHKKIDNL